MVELSARLNDFGCTQPNAIWPTLATLSASVPAICDGGWSRKQILGHLIDSASNNHQRFVRARLQDELRWPGYDQSGCVQRAAISGARWRFAAFWAAYNRFLAHVTGSRSGGETKHAMLDWRLSGDDTGRTGSGLH